MEETERERMGVTWGGILSPRTSCLLGLGPKELGGSKRKDGVKAKEQKWRAQIAVGGMSLTRAAKSL